MEAVPAGALVRPRKHLLLYADREQEGSTLAYTLSVALHVTVDRVESSAALATALHQAWRRSQRQQCPRCRF